MPEFSTAKLLGASLIIISLFSFRHIAFRTAAHGLSPSQVHTSSQAASTTNRRSPITSAAEESSTTSDKVHSGTRAASPPTIISRVHSPLQPPVAHAVHSASSVQTAVTPAPSQPQCGLPEEQHTYGHTAPECEVLWGEYDKRRYQGPHVTGIPVTFRRSAMEPSLRQWLFGCRIFDVPERDLPALGFLSDLDDLVYTHGGESGPHRYYEGYFHGLEQSSAHIGSSHPRYGLKKVLDKPAAPTKLRAFLSALRQANPWMAQIMAVLAAEMRQRAAADPESAESLEQLAALFSRPEAFFSDLAVQVHFGQQQEPIWHNDGVNSILHMALSINGNRELRMLARGPEDAPDKQHQVFRANGATKWDTGTAREAKTRYGQPRRDRSQIDWEKQFLNPMSPGDVYISSPTGFLHGVDYPECSYTNRIIAVQCRLLMTRDESYTMLSVMDVDEWVRIIADRVTPLLKRAELQMPSFSDVQATHDQLLQTIENKHIE